jgi:hypothetical protein
MERLQKNFPYKRYVTTSGYVPKGAREVRDDSFQLYVCDVGVSFKTPEAIQINLRLPAENIHKQHHETRVSITRGGFLGLQEIGRVTTEIMDWKMDDELIRNELDQVLREAKGSSIGRALHLIQNRRGMSSNDRELREITQAFVLCGKPEVKFVRPMRISARMVSIEDDPPDKIDTDVRCAADWVRFFEEQDERGKVQQAGDGGSQPSSSDNAQEGK